jgi:hypothetical protein
MKIFVTKHYIRYGLRYSRNFCPIARAVKRQTRWKEVDVQNEVFFEGTNVESKLPLKAMEFIDRFDEGQYVKPFSFVIPNRLLAQLPR